ncbi:MAG: response regulator [Lachnospiraceae bacterium]|nr:response regulator [Lachnospiraceae bacterium]
MYKVAIIDDEPIIVEGLTKTMPWEKWNMQVIGFAYDGKEGLSLIRRERPDIIISDINMPQLDGLKMIAGLKSEFPNMQIVILTGYREFEYAREAISLGVTRFLLKPSKMNELEEAMDAVKGKLVKLGISGEEHPADESARSTEAEEEILYNNEANSFIVKNALEYIRENYKEKLRLSDVADQIYVSQWHLSKLLNKQMGQNFSEILNGIRMEKAKELLKDPSLRICDIAEEVGFLDMAHFSRVFKKLEGMSANEYRNKH